MYTIYNKKYFKLINLEKVLKIRELVIYFILN